MADLLWMLVCKESIVDVRSNNVTLVNIIEEIMGPPGDEVFGVHLVVVILWRRTEQSDEEEVTYRLRWLDQGGNEIQTVDPMSFTIAESKQRQRSFHSLLGLPIRGPGRYSLVVECLADDDEYEEAGRYDIEIRRQAEA